MNSISKETPTRILIKTLEPKSPLKKGNIFFLISNQNIIGRTQIHKTYIRKIPNQKEKKKK